MGHELLLPLKTAITAAESLGFEPGMIFLFMGSVWLLPTRIYYESFFIITCYPCVLCV